MSSKFLILLIFASLITISCSSCKQEEVKTGENLSAIPSTENLTFVGQLTKVGNEPFTKLGLMVNDTTIYILECNDSTTNELKNSQGQKFKIYANKKVKTELGTKIIVNRFEKIK